MTAPVVSVTELTKCYGKATVLSEVSFDVYRGEMFGLLGPNGAGKTTTLEIIEGLRRPDSGRVRVAGADPTSSPGRVPDLIGVQLQTGSLPAAITVREAFSLFAAYHRVAPDFSLLDRLGLAGREQVQYGVLSTGQQRRLALALALVHRPPVLILDEPTAGLDVPARARFHDLLRELRDDGHTIILSTHDMAEAEQLADRVAILLAGRIAAGGSPRTLTAAAGRVSRISVLTSGACLRESGREFPGVTRSVASGDYMVYFSPDVAASVGAILDCIHRSGERLIDLRVQPPGLEEMFLDLVEQEGRS